MKEIWRIAMASEIPWYSSEIVRKKRKITDMGITIFSETCIRSMAAAEAALADSSPIRKLLPAAF
ncbi:hypothetical protein [Blautia segnis]|uniref:Uncharacterized protein n=1 Tax=Blautia segnis TaxID=2763030 RepID=A0A8I0DS98_9FIRM|nr:hypothetical protein [Blautia segnis]